MCKESDCTVVWQPIDLTEVELRESLVPLRPDRSTPLIGLEEEKHLGIAFQTPLNEFA